MTQPSLLPSNRTDFELAVSKTSAERRALPAALVKSVWNPETCPADLLGWLAWQLSVDVWDEAWPEVKKREACRKAFLMHRVKTTLAGVKQHVAMAGSEVLKTVRPPGRGFLYAAMTDAQRRAWLDSLPQVRVYPYFHGGIAKSRMFYNGPAGKTFHSSRTLGSVPLLDLTDDAGDPITSGVGPAVTEPAGSVAADDAVVFITGFARKNRGAALYGRRATLYDRGVETDVFYDAIDGSGVERVRFGRVSKRLWHGSGYEGRGFLSKTLAAQGVVTIGLSDDANLFAVSPSVTPVKVQPQRVSQQRIAPASRSFFGRFRNGRFMRQSFGPLLVYDRISLNDPTRMGSRRKTRSYHGHGRFGIPDYTAELMIRVPMKRPKRTACRWHGNGYRQAADMKPLDMAIQAVRASKAFRDTVLIDTATYGQVKFSSGLRFGEFAFGEIEEVA